MHTYIHTYIQVYVCRYIICMHVNNIIQLYNHNNMKGKSIS